MKSHVNQGLKVATVEHLKCSLHRYTFSIGAIRKWVELQCEGRVLNLFAGKTLLTIDEIRNDISPDMNADYHLDAFEFLQTWSGKKFNTVIMDPPYSYRKSMELYDGRICSPFYKIKQEIPRILMQHGRVITLGHHSIVMGRKRGFELEKVCIVSHGGAIHDTIISVERNCNN